MYLYRTLFFFLSGFHEDKTEVLEFLLLSGGSKNQWRSAYSGYWCTSVPPGSRSSFHRELSSRCSSGLLRAACVPWIMASVMVHFMCQLG